VSELPGLRPAWAEVDLDAVRAGRRFFDPVGHYHRPDVFRLSVDARARRAFTLVPEDATGAAE
jgi:nitrilase